MSSGDLVRTVRQVARAGEDVRVAANLSVTVAGTDVAVGTVDDRVRVQIPSVSAAVSILRREGRRLPDIARTLSDAGVTVEVRIGGALVALVGAAATGGLLSDSLSLGPVELYETNLLRAALRLR